MFKRENRLGPEIRFGNSHSFAVSQFILKEKRNGMAVNRFGIIVSKKIDKRAVARNKIKRFFRAKLLDLGKKMSAGHDMLFVIRKGIVGKSREENNLAIENVLKRAGVI